MELDGLFLDMYGTLTTGDRLAVETVCGQLVREAGLRLSAYELSILWGERFFDALDYANNGDFCTLFEVEARTLRETLAELGVALDPYPYVRRLSDYWCSPPLQPEVRAFLDKLALPVCIVSNADRQDLERALACHQIRVDHVVTSEDVRCYKPAARIFEAALARTGWRRQRVLHVGDSLHSDVAGAQAVGLRTGWVNRVHRIHDIGTAAPDYEFADLLALAELLAAAEKPAGEKAAGLPTPAIAVSSGVSHGEGRAEPRNQAAAGPAGQGSPPNAAVIFDLDGVLTDTAELHFQSWLELAAELDIPFDRAANEALRGLSRAESLRLFLGTHAARFTPGQQAEIMTRKNAAYVARVARLGPADLLPGAAELLAGLRAAGVPLAVASSSRNAGLVLNRLGIRGQLDALVDGNDVTRSKPDPELFQTAARRLNTSPARCIVLEDAESGIAAALAAGMRVIGIGPPARVGRAHRVVAALAELDPPAVLALLPA